jgi:Flp pilus assembly pilin Flp
MAEERRRSGRNSTMTRKAISCVCRQAVRLFTDDRGQDLIEYALLTALVAVAGMLVIPSILTGMANAYNGWNTNAQAAAPMPAPIP